MEDKDESDKSSGSADDGRTTSRRRVAPGQILKLLESGGNLGHRREEGKDADAKTFRRRQVPVPAHMVITTIVSASTLSLAQWV